MNGIIVKSNYESQMTLQKQMDDEVKTNVYHGNLRYRLWSEQNVLYIQSNDDNKDNYHEDIFYFAIPIEKAKQFLLVLKTEMTSRLVWSDGHEYEISYEVGKICFKCRNNGSYRCNGKTVIFERNDVLMTNKEQNLDLILQINTLLNLYNNINKM